MIEGMGRRLKTARGQWLLMAGLNTGCQIPESEIKRQHVSGL
jgi:hypothetical protein